MTASWPLSVLLPSLPVDFVSALRETARLGFTHVDVVALDERPAEHLDALADTGQVVCCASLGRDLPPGCALDVLDVERRRPALRVVERQLTDAARLGATAAYLVPPLAEPPGDGSLHLAAFTEACVLLARHAAGLRVRLCVEHFPGRLLPTVSATLAWLEETGADGLALLLDVGHCLISGEDPADAARRAGPRLGYVHLDDNDGEADLHWPLLTGRLTEQHLRDLEKALCDVGYQGAVALELSPLSANPRQALADGKAVVERTVLGERRGARGDS